MRKMTRLYAAAWSASLIAIAFVVSTGVQAQRYEYEPVGYVTAQSDFGTETVTGAVRRQPRGLQVQMPGGTWIWCKKSCKETLRLATVDFWHSEEGRGRDGATSHGEGLFGKLQWGWGW